MAGSSGNGKVVPAAYPPPVDSPAEFIKRELDGEDEIIEVGIAIVGGGTAGLACANRILQLLADDPETLERLGEVPVAVIEKAKTCGGHNLSGAVMRPGPLQELFPDMTREDWRKEGFAFGEVAKEAVYMLPSKGVQAPHPDAAAVQEPRQRGHLGLRDGPLPAADRRGGRRVHPHRDVGHPADRRGGPRRRSALRRQGPRQGWARSSATSSPARTSRPRSSSSPTDAGAASPVRRSASSTSARTVSRRSGSSASRRSGRSPSRSIASSTRSAPGR